ncbi:MAG TPA: long-chain fatty acid--CoA ligase [Gemmatimonadales bacterium]|nr:long-chain fatty acid--CoA ligase [Gemmatimonadales bacterium]
MTDPRTLNEIFFQRLDQAGQRPVAMRAKRGGVWVDISYDEVRDLVQCLAAGFRELGITPKSTIAVLSENRPEWAYVDFACLSIRCADVPIYPTLPAGQVSYILRDSGAVAIVVSSRSQLEKILELRHPDLTPALRHIIAIEPDATGPGVMPFGDLVQRGRAALARYPHWRDEALTVEPGDLATLIYTSGTTGDPKGVMLTHGNLCSNVVSGLKSLDLVQSDECLSFLPLSHVFERMAGHYCMWQAGALITYAQSVDSVPADMMDRKPTVVLSVPRLYEKIFARVLEGASASRLKRRIFNWARANGEAWAEHAVAKRPVPFMLGLKKTLADRLVFSKLRARTGGRLRFFCSGGAPLSPEIAKFFFAAGLPIYEGYGLTETSPVITVNSKDHTRIGTVGRPIDGVEVRIAPDGEILTRGPHVMKGYYNKPEATAEAIDREGWFHTGDIGLIDGDGFLRITDRKKDIIVTAGGKNIAPQPIENRVKTNKFVLNAVMLGDKRKFPIMLVVPNLDAVKEWATSAQLAFPTSEAMLASQEVGDKIEREVKKTLRDLAHFEMPKKIVLIGRDFTIESGELTPTLKVKRRVVEKNYRSQIEAVYSEPKGGTHDV